MGPAKYQKGQRASVIHSIFIYIDPIYNKKDFMTNNMYSPSWPHLPHTSLLIFMNSLRNPIYKYKKFLSPVVAFRSQNGPTDVSSGYRGICLWRKAYFPPFPIRPWIAVLVGICGCMGMKRGCDMLEFFQKCHVKPCKVQERLEFCKVF